MTISIVKTNFTAGELSYSMLGRGDIKAYENGALFLRNVSISPMGGVSRRAGLRFIDILPSRGRLIPFSFNTEQTYLLVLIDKQLLVYKNEVMIATLTTPWETDDLIELRWTQSADTLLIAHKDYPLKKISRLSHTEWTIEDWTFYEAKGFIYQPYFNFAKTETQLSLSGLSGNITITASLPVFSEAYIGKHLHIDTGEVEVTGFTSDTVISARVTTDALPNRTTSEWQEPVFSDIRGYPVSVTFHQGRLVIGGSRDLPNRLWMSKSNDLPNFDLGEGLDDEAISFGLLSDEVNAIKGLLSGRHLQVFTSGAEWMVSGDPLTPSSIQLKRQTRVGSPSYAYVPFRNVDGATLFTAADGKSMREFLFSDLEEVYQSEDVALLSSHLISYPIDADYNPAERFFYVVMMNGDMAVLTNYRSEAVSAWSKYETDGDFVSVSVTEGKVFVVTRRGMNYFLEVFDKDIYTDMSMLGEEDSPKREWSGLSIMEGKEVAIVADGIIVDKEIVTNGKISLEHGAKEVVIGLPYTHKVVPLPHATHSANRRAVKSIRMIRGIFKVLNTASLRIDVGMGMISAIPLQFDKDAFTSKMQAHTTDIILHGIGWIRDALAKPLWKIESELPAPFSLIAVTTEMKVSE